MQPSAGRSSRSGTGESLRKFVNNKLDNTYLDAAYLDAAMFAGGLGMKGRLEVSPKAGLLFVFFLFCFDVLFALDRGEGVVSHIWGPLVWGLIAFASLAIYIRIWRVRKNPGEMRKIEAQSLYGILPLKLRNWLFP
ncbi:MAG: hypothetical protein K5821_01840 [Nitrobacter sp.]|nr:hypothetical protein [Nitrobacter sp.]